MFYTYIIYTPSKDRFYIGASENPSERLKKHNAKNKGFTQQAADWKIVYQKEFPSKSEALKHEKLFRQSAIKQGFFSRLLLIQVQQSSLPQQCQENSLVSAFIQGKASIRVC